MKLISVFILVFCWFSTLGKAAGFDTEDCFFKRPVQKLSFVEVDSAAPVQKKWRLQPEVGIGLTNVKWLDGTSDHKLLISKPSYSVGMNIIYAPINKNYYFLGGAYYFQNTLTVWRNKGVFYINHLGVQFLAVKTKIVGAGCQIHFDVGSKLNGYAPRGLTGDQVPFAKVNFGPKLWIGYDFGKVKISASSFFLLKPVFREVPGLSSPHHATSVSSYRMMGINFNVAYLII